MHYGTRCVDHQHVLQLWVTGKRKALGKRKKREAGSGKKESLGEDGLWYFRPVECFPAISFHVFFLFLSLKPNW